jgi:hypothetical protein
MQSLICHGAMQAAAIAAVLLMENPGTLRAQVGSDGQAIEHGTGKDRLQVQLKLTDVQRQAIADAVRKENKAVTPPPSFVASVGAPVPPAIELYILPDNALAQVPAAKEVKYTVLNDQLLLVDPTTMRVVDIIQK